MVLSSAALIGWMSPATTVRAASLPFVVALIVLGMPHGGADWAVAARLSHRSGFIAQLWGFVPYLLMMAGCLLALLLVPGVTVLAFLALTVFHFGMADATALRADDDGPLARWSLVISRGLLLLATVFAVHPEAAWEPFGQIVNAMGVWPQGAWQPDPLALQPWAVVGSVFGVLLACVSAGIRVLHHHRREALSDLCESALVVVLAYYADPLFAVGVYFIGVHAFRHCRRLSRTRIVMEPPPISAHFFRNMFHVHVLSFPLMVATAACLVPLCIVIGGFDMRSIAIASIAFYIISTLPHHLLGLELPAPEAMPK